jgi:hypothetical protein
VARQRPPAPAGTASPAPSGAGSLVRSPAPVRPAARPPRRRRALVASTPPLAMKAAILLGTTKWLAGRLAPPTVKALAQLGLRRGGSHDRQTGPDARLPVSVRGCPAYHWSQVAQAIVTGEASGAVCKLGRRASLKV